TLLRASVNETCFRDLDCDVSLVCAPQGRCRPTCNNNNDCSFDGTSCDYYSAFRTGVCGANCSFDETPGSSCGTYPFNCGCPSGESCKVTEGQASVCVQDGPQTTFEWCTRDEHCGVDLSCQGGLCRPICDPDDTSSDAFTCGGRFGTCMTSLISNEAETTVCSGYCDPVEPLNVDPLRRPCGEGGYCYPGIGDIKHAFCVQEDISHSPRTNGEECDDEYDCRSGLGCSNGTCQAYCHSEAPCSGNRTCNILSPKRYGKDQTELLGLCQ